MSEGMYSYIPECISAVEMETTEATIRVDVSEDSLGLIRIIPKTKAGNDLAELVDGCITFSPVFCAEIFQLLAEHCEVWRSKVDAELENQEQDNPAIFGTKKEVQKIAETHGPMFKQPVTESMESWAAK